MLDCTPVLALALTHCRLIKQLFRCFHNQNVQFSDLNCIFKWISCNLQDLQVVPLIFCCIRPGGDNKILGLANEHEIKNGSLIVAPKERVLPGLPPPPGPYERFCIMAPLRQMVCYKINSKQMIKHILLMDQKLFECKSWGSSS